VARLVAALTAKDPQYRPGNALAVAEWARRIRGNPQVIQAVPGPVLTSGSLIPAEPAREATRSPHRRIVRGSAATVLLLLAVCAGWTAQHRFGYTLVRTSAGVPGPGWAAVTPSAYYGIPVATAAQRLQALHLRTQTRSVAVPGHRNGTVIGITPAGDISLGTMITLYVAIAAPADPSHALAPKAGR
jgi:hypothetical protein